MASKAELILNIHDPSAITPESTIRDLGDSIGRTGSFSGRDGWSQGLKSTAIDTPLATWQGLFA
jgi:hypothetical protein